MTPESLDYDPVERYLRGELSLHEVDASQEINHGSRALIALVFVLNDPAVFTVEREDKITFNGSLREFYGDVFGWRRALPILNVSRDCGLHRKVGTDRTMVELLFPQKLLELFEQHKTSDTVMAPAEVYYAHAEHNWYAGATAAELDERTKRIINCSSGLMDTLEEPELILLIRIMRRKLADKDAHTDPQHPLNLSLAWARAFQKARYEL